MNLDPTVSPWIGIFASTGVCLWMAAIGAPLAKAVFGERPRPVWPFYAPALGVVAVLLTTNLSAYLIPGAPSAWFGLLAPSALAAFVAWRTGQIRPPSGQTLLASLALLLACTGVYLLAFANRTQKYHVDEAWYYALTLRLAKGVFPPITPYGVDAGIGYHYGPIMLAASIVNTAAVPAWTALIVLLSFFVVTLILAGIGLARDLGGSLPLSIGTGAVLGVSGPTILVGLPPYVEVSGEPEGFVGFLEGLASAEPSAAFGWQLTPHYALALIIVILIAAALEFGTTSRTTVVIAGAAGVSALASATVLIFASAALGLVSVFRLAWLRGRERLTLAAALLVGGLLAALAGGPASDALFGRSGSATMVQIAFEPDWSQLAPFDLRGPALIGIGILPLLAISAMAAYRNRSWALWYLTAAGVFGVVASIFIQSRIPSNDGRFLHFAGVVAVLAALSGVSRLSDNLRGFWRVAVTLFVILFAVLPMVVPRATAGVRLAAKGFAVGDPVSADSGYPYVGHTPDRRELFRKDLEENWVFYSWLADSLPNDARLLTTHPAGSASVAGVAAPTSGISLQVLSPRVSPVYEDALRFLHRDDLADMQITHLHVTDAWKSALTSEAQNLLENPNHFRIIADIQSISGRRHRVFEVIPGAGTTRVNSASFRDLRQSVPSDQPFVILDGLSEFQRQMLLYNFVNHKDLRSPRTYPIRAVHMPRASPVSSLPDSGTVAISERIDPLMLGLTADDAIWAGYGIRVYDLVSAWSPVRRVGSDPSSPSESFQSLCERSSNGELHLKLLGEPGDEVLLGPTSAKLNGRPQTFTISTGTCQTLRLATEASVPPFAQVRPLKPDRDQPSGKAEAALGFDSSIAGDLVIISIWYRNPDEIEFSAGTEFRLYEVGPVGITPVSPNARLSKRWWMGPLALSASTQMARIEFDPVRLQINGADGGGVANEIVAGRTYLLTLNVSVVESLSGLAEIQQQIPLVRFTADDGTEVPEAFAGIVRIGQLGKVTRISQEYNSKIGWQIDRTPRFETNSSFVDRRDA